MKRSTCLIGSVIAVAIFFTTNSTHAQLLKRLKQTVQNHVENRAEERTGEATDKALDKTEAAAKGDKSTNAGTDSNVQESSSDNATASSGKINPPSLQTYQNYDFVPGDTVLFADDFTEDQTGEFPSHWNLTKGQAVVNQVTGKPAFLFTDGNYCNVTPLMKKKTYLTDPFTVEFDTYTDGNGNESPILFLTYIDKNGNSMDGEIAFDKGDDMGRGDVTLSYFPNNLSADLPKPLKASYVNNWHHCAVIYKNNQLKCYVDQYRILTVPNLGCVPVAFGFEGIGDQEHPIVITNIRVAAGGNMNMLGKKFTESKIVTHGINFDIDKASIKPESMGTLNMIVNVMKNNPDVKFEIDGHTDNTGESAHNLTLSQQRADAVKAQLIKMGIDESRLTTKGFGDTKPMDSNDTPEGKSNNRRVEFVKI